MAKFDEHWIPTGRPAGKKQLNSLSSGKPKSTSVKHYESRAIRQGLNRGTASDDSSSSNGGGAGCGSRLLKKVGGIVNGGSTLCRELGEEAKVIQTTRQLLQHERLLLAPLTVAGAAPSPRRSAGLPSGRPPRPPPVSQSTPPPIQLVWRPGVFSVRPGVFSQRPKSRCSHSLFGGAESLKRNYFGHPSTHFLSPFSSQILFSFNCECFIWVLCGVF